MKLYANFDRVAGVYDSPVTMHNDSYAKRAISSALNDPKHNVKIEQIEDFALYCLGDINLTTGEIVGEVRFVCNLIDLYQPKIEKEEN